jgi:hypothetical protein
MHIDQAKAFIIGELKSSGFNPYNARGKTGDFMVYPSGKEKRVQIIALDGSDLKSQMSDIAERIKTSIEEGCEVTFEDNRTYFINPNWQVKERKKKVVVSNTDDDTSTSTTSNSKDRSLSETSKPKTASDEELHEGFNTELKRLNLFGDRFETILDEFILNKLSTKELLGQIFDGLQKQNIKIYTTAVPIQVVEDKFVIPHITKETFIATGLASLKK